VRMKDTSKDIILRPLREISMLGICTCALWKVSNFRHPRIQPDMLKEMFGGPDMVENIKIVPDRNVVPCKILLMSVEPWWSSIRLCYNG
jgi:hypothetical protein